MVRFGRIGVFFVACLMLCGCELLTLATGDSGITGTIVSGPQCPVQTDPPQPGCEDQPLVATVVVRSAILGLEVTRFTSAPDGTFTVALAPGSYILDPQPGANGFPNAPSQSVTVVSRTFAHVDIQYDTGIR